MSVLGNTSPAGERAVILPTAPQDLTCAVKAWRETVKILTYEAKSPDPNQVFLENRVYRGSSARDYPLPFIDTIATARERLGQVSETKATFYSILNYADQLGQSTPKIDYFATSLPIMPLCNEDLGGRNRIESRFLRAQAMTGLGEQDQALTLVHQVLHDAANHIATQDLLLQLQGGRQELVSS